jgi:hypothetical protein
VLESWGESFFQRLSLHPPPSSPSLLRLWSWVPGEARAVLLLPITFAWRDDLAGNAGLSSSLKPRASSLRAGNARAGLLLAKIVEPREDSGGISTPTNSQAPFRTLFGVGAGLVPARMAGAVRAATRAAPTAVSAKCAKNRTRIGRCRDFLQPTAYSLQSQCGRSPRCASAESDAHGNVCRSPPRIPWRSRAVEALSCPAPPSRI